MSKVFKKKKISSKTTVERGLQGVRTKVFGFLESFYKENPEKKENRCFYDFNVGIPPLGEEFVDLRILIEWANVDKGFGMEKHNTSQMVKTMRNKIIFDEVISIQSSLIPTAKQLLRAYFTDNEFEENPLLVQQVELRLEAANGVLKELTTLKYA